MDKKNVERLKVFGFAMTAEGHLTGTFKHGLKIGDTVHRDFEMREARGEDLFAAEDEAEMGRPLTYNMAVAARQLIRSGSYEGPFTLQMLARLKQSDIALLRQAQLEVERLGEG